MTHGPLGVDSHQGSGAQLCRHLGGHELDTLTRNSGLSSAMLSDVFQQVKRVSPL